MPLFTETLETLEDFLEFACCAEEDNCSYRNYPLYLSANNTSRDVFEKMSDMCTNEAAMQAQPTGKHDYTAERMYWILYGLMLNDGAL